MYYDNYFEELKFALTKIDRNILTGIESMMQKRDLIIILSVSGNSSNLVKAVKYAKENNTTVISIVGDYKGKVLDYSDMSLIVNSKNYGIVEDIQLSLGHMISQNIKNSNIDIYR